MTFARAFRLSSYLLLLSGFLSLFASEAVSLLLTSLYLMAMVVSWRHGFQLPNWLQLTLFLGLIGFFLVDALALSDFISATVHLLIVVSLIKLFTVAGERDYLILYFISFGFLLFAAAYTISISFLLSLVFYIFSAILTFILFESKRAYEENRNSPFSLASYVNVALVISGLIILISIPIFLVIPRASMGLFRVDRSLDLNMSGFSDQVRLGDMGEIIVGSNVLMRVKVDTEAERLPHDLKWRGIALDRYDGKKWSNTRDGFRRIHHDHHGEQGVLVSEDRRRNEFLVQQTVILEPFSNMLFGAPEMVLLSGEGLHRSFVFEDGNDSLGIYRRGRGPIKYLVYSDVMRRSEKLEEPVEGIIEESIRRRYLQLPRINPAIGQLALQITADHPGPVEKSLALEHFLKRSYGYTLANESARAEDPLSDFLLVTKAGHCEFFATAQAVMMRSLGIPARLVNGFRMGDFNDLSGYFVVRQSDAHSWVEGYFPGPGWVEFDPTPASDDGSDAFMVTRFFSQLLDAIDIFWTELITFDRIKQVGFFRSLGENLRHGWKDISTASLKLADLASLKWLEGLKRWNYWNLLYLLILPLLGVLGWLGHRYRRYLRAFWKQRVLKQQSFQVAPEYYLDMLDMLHRRGLEKAPAETPAEFAERIRLDLESPIPGRITACYYQNRFGNVPLRQRDLSQVYRWLRELR